MDSLLTLLNAIGPQHWVILGLILLIAEMASGALIVNSVGGAFAQLQVIAMSENAPQAAEVHETIRLLNVNLNLGGWLLLGAPLVVMGAMLLGADPTRKPGPMPLAPLFPLIGVWLAAALGVFAFAWSWIQVGDAEAMLRERMPQPQKLVASLDALLFGAFLLGATFVLVALPAAMSALAMASDAEPAADQTTDAK